MVDGLAVIISKSSRVKGSNSDPQQQQQQQQGRVWMPPVAMPAPPPGPAPNAAGPPHHPPHIPPPPPFPPMAAFQRRRDDWGGGGGGGLGLLGVLPPAPHLPPDMAPQHNFHGANNPNIQDVQRLNNFRGAPRGALGRGNPPVPPQSLNLSPRGEVEGRRGGVNDRDHLRQSASSHSGAGNNGGEEEQPGPSHHPPSHHTHPNDIGAPSHRPGLALHPSPSPSPSPADSDSDSDQEPSAGAQAPRPGFPSIRPNAMHNRQRQLDMLRKHEDRMWRSRNSNNSQLRGEAQGGGNSIEVTPRNPMVLHVLDLSRVVSGRTAAWLPTRDTPIPHAPEETIFYSLVQGRAELVLFGGIRRVQNPMQRVNSPPDAGFNFVTNGLFIISPRAVKPL
ncbi:hypothetical protein ACOMHN_017617 [Nucella lapillus]